MKELFLVKKRWLWDMRRLEKGERRRFFEMLLNNWTKNGTVDQSTDVKDIYLKWYTGIFEIIP